MNKIKVKTNKGMFYDLYLNTKINFLLWFIGIHKDQDQAIMITSLVIHYKNVDQDQQETLPHESDPLDIERKSSA